MTGQWKLIPYDCQDGECLMIWHTGRDSKLGALSLDHQSIGEAIVDELNRLEDKFNDIDIYVESVEEANKILKDVRDDLRKENEQLKIALKDKENLISICEKKFKELGYLITCDDNGYTVEKI